MKTRRFESLIAGALVLALGKLACSAPAPAQPVRTSSRSDAGTDGDPGGGGDCEDTESDAENCGSCGHACKEGTCEDGRCELIIVATDDSNPRSVVAVDGSVYWTAEGNGTATSGSIRVLAKGQTDVRTLAESLKAPIDITFADGQLYWTNWLDTNAVMALPIAGGTPRTVATLAYGGSDHLTIVGDRIFWAVNPLAPGLQHHVHSIKRDGSDPRDYVSNTTDIAYAGPVSVGGKVYWSERTASGKILQSPIASTAATTFESGQASPSWLASDGESLFWAGGGKVSAKPFAGGDTKVLASVGRVGGMTADAANVYAIDLGEKSVVAIPKEGGDPVTLAVSDVPPVELFVDDDFVYFTYRDTDGKGGVAKVSK